MTIDVLIVDDEPTILIALTAIFKYRGIEAVTFSMPSQARDYLSTVKIFPSTYLVDMRTPPELEGPEEFYNYIKKVDSVNNFYFYTGPFSPHDDEVIRRTGAKYFIKPDLMPIITTICNCVDKAKE